MAFPDRTFEVIIFDWDGTAVPDRQADASPVRSRVEALCRAGVDVAVVSGTHVGNIDGQLHARPSGPGRLYLCLNRGSEVFAVTQDGPQLVFRRVATAQEEAALDRAAELAVAKFSALGLGVEVVSSRLNRRKIDLIPEPAWADPPKARIAELLSAVTARLTAHGIATLAGAVEIATAAAQEAGLADARITSDAKHVEIGLTDKSDSAAWMLEASWQRGIGPGLVLIAGDEFGSMGGVPGSDSLILIPRAARSIAISVGDEPEGVPQGVQHFHGGPARFVALLDDQLTRRRMMRTPSIDEDPAWVLSLENSVPELERVHETLLTVADGTFGTRGAREEDGGGSDPLVVAQGIYSKGATGLPALTRGPWWPGLTIETNASCPERRVIDLRTGVLQREIQVEGTPLQTVRFSSMAEPGVMAMRAEGPAEAIDAQPDLAPATVAAGSGGMAAATWSSSRSPDRFRTIERLGRYLADPLRLPGVEQVSAEGGRLHVKGFDRILAEHRAEWASRWADAEIAIEGDPQAERDVRFALFHLMASVADRGEAAVGARGLSGEAYLGHVFWDADVFVLPMLAATHPASARAMLEYRLRRLPAAQAVAAARGYAGARFPWESAGDGTDVTPRSVRDHDGRLVPVLTGDHEEHISADVAWAAWHYAQWSGDVGFLSGPGRPLIVETARYWASRARFDAAGRAHIDRVEGPDEYHVPVDDNGFTNVMARWNLRRAADLIVEGGTPGDVGEADRWRAIAGALVDGYASDSGLYEQFAGFFKLEPLIIADIARPPVAADVLLGPGRVAGSQIIKQPDVLMLHHLVPEEVAPGSLHPNLAFYGPRTAHGSSLSPAIHAGLMAGAGRPDDALQFLRIALRIDLDDLTGTTAGGLHLAAFGGVWQALAYGFLGIWPSADGLAIDPRLPQAWNAVEMTVRFRGTRVRIRAAHDRLTIWTDAPVPVRLSGGPPVIVHRSNLTFQRTTEAWELISL